MDHVYLMGGGGISVHNAIPFIARHPYAIANKNATLITPNHHGVPGEADQCARILPTPPTRIPRTHKKKIQWGKNVCDSTEPDIRLPNMKNAGSLP